MSDGMSMAARSAASAAGKFVKEHYPDTKRVHMSRIPASGLVCCIYETWLDHVIEIIEDRKLIKRYNAKGYGNNPVTELPITDDDWQVGHYYHNPPPSGLCG